MEEEAFEKLITYINKQEGFVKSSYTITFGKIQLWTGTSGPSLYMVNGQSLEIGFTHPQKKRAGKLIRTIRERVLMEAIK